jgi:MFS family permease
MDTFVSTPGTSPTPTTSFKIIYLISVIFTFHTLLTAYSSSSYLEQFGNTTTIGFAYALGSALSIILFFQLTPILRLVGNTILTVTLSLIAVSALIALGLGIAPLIAFVIFMAINPLLYLSIDIFSESAIGSNEGQTGQKRGLTLSLMATASVLAPLTMGLIAGESNERLAYTYFVAAGVGLLFVSVIYVSFRGFTDPPYPRIQTRAVLRAFFTTPGIRSVVCAHFLLQFFFAWIVIYFPLYLATELHVPWSTLGIIIAAGLIAYVLFEYPIGILADRFWGEKEMMATGFVVLALSSASIGFLAAVGTIGWMLVMFVSRIGASLVEVTTESYFFKQVRSSDAPLISLFRLTRPVANLTGALTGSLALLALPFPLLFVLLGVLMVPGIILAAFLVDTR